MLVSLELLLILLLASHLPIYYSRPLITLNFLWWGGFNTRIFNQTIGLTVLITQINLVYHFWTYLIFLIQVLHSEGERVTMD